jgi:hypothetical protein
MSYGTTKYNTKEQEHRDHITSIFGNAEDNTDFFFEQEKKEDLKCAMLAEIDSLRDILSDERVDLKRVPDVDKDSDYDLVSKVLRMLRHKNDHLRYCGFAEEFLVFGAQSLGDVFDGSRTWFGRYQPDLRGWHTHVAAKLKRVRHDTGQLVSGVMHNYNIGPGLRVLLELIPNMFMYSRMKRTQQGQPSLFCDDEMVQARNRLNDM